MNNELFHSSVYYGKDFSDGLHHYKYVKRYKKNGKWRYIYDYMLTGKGYKREAEEASKRKISKSNEAFNYSQKAASSPNKPLNYGNSVRRRKYYSAKADAAKAAANRQEDKYYNATDNYYNKSLAGISKKTISRGRNMVAKILADLANKVSDNSYASKYKSFDSYKNSLKRQERTGE